MSEGYSYFLFLLGQWVRQDSMWAEYYKHIATVLTYTMVDKLIPSTHALAKRHPFLSKSPNTKTHTKHE